MTIEDAERALEGGPYPWPNLLAVYQATRDEKARETDRDQEQVREEYESKVADTFRASGLRPLSREEAERIRLNLSPL